MRYPVVIWMGPSCQMPLRYHYLRQTVSHLQSSCVLLTVLWVGPYLPCGSLGRVLWATSCSMSVTFLSCNWCSWLKLCRRHSHTLLILLSHKLRDLYVGSPNPHGKNVGCVQLCHLHSSFGFITNYALLHLISLAFHLLTRFPSHIDITALLL